jgi:hypothetical protein
MKLTDVSEVHTHTIFKDITLMMQAVSTSKILLVDTKQHPETQPSSNYIDISSTATFFQSKLQQK